jgi:hypothetical protein
MLFPNSSWEIEKPTQTDWEGLIAFGAAGLFLIFLLYLVSLIGS